MVLMIQYNLTITTTSDRRVFCVMYGQHTLYSWQGFVGLLYCFVHLFCFVVVVLGGPNACGRLFIGCSLLVLGCGP